MSASEETARKRSVASLLVVAGVLLTAAWGLADPAAAQSVRQAFAPVADAHVNHALPKLNFGGRTRLRADAAPLVRSYVRFDVRGLNGRVAAAWLHFTTLAASPRGVRVHPVYNTTWRERRITFANSPSLKTPIARSRPFRAGRRISLNVTERIEGNGRVTFALTTRSFSSVPVASREAPRLIEPRLVVKTVVPQLPAGADPVLVGAGDIAGCERRADDRTAALLDWIPGVVYTLGDNVYPDGSERDFTECYDTSWGRHRSRTRPSVGNHEYVIPGAAGYFGYFGELAGDPAGGYYSYDLGAWHVVVLNSNCSEVACEAGSAQEQWLRADLAAHPAACTVAYMHHPRFSSNGGGNPTVAAFWDALYEHGADLVLAGHRHNYERFAAQTPDGDPDSATGVRQFIAGTGGRSHADGALPIANSEVYDATTFGVLKLTLHAASYDWQFVPLPGSTFTDAGSGLCH
jgi:Calcineurin-like phosphoesterase